MNMKFLSAMLSAALLATLAACGAPSPRPSGDTPLATPSTQSDPQPEVWGPFRTEATLAETVMVDEGGVKITATSLTYTAYSVDLELTIENNSGRDLSFVSGSLGYSCNSINGYMVDDGYLNCDVANGKKANESMSFGYDALMLYGIDEIADMEIGFSMSDDNYDTIYSGPIRLKTSAFDTHDYDTNTYQQTITSQAAMDTYGYEMTYFTQDTLYEQSGVKLLSSGVMTNSNGETALLLELENTTDAVVYLSVSDLAINSLLLNSSVWSNDAINPGRRRIVDVDLSAVLDPAFWKAYGLTEVGSISLALEPRGEDGVEIAAKVPVQLLIPGMNVSFDASGTEVYNSNGLRILGKTVAEDSADYGADLYVLLLAENNSGKTLTIDDAYDSLSVNGFMTDYTYYSQELADGESAVLAIQLWESSLEENHIASISDIQEIEAGFEIKEGYTTIDEPMLTLVFGE